MKARPGLKYALIATAFLLPFNSPVDESVLPTQKEFRSLVVRYTQKYGNFYNNPVLGFDCYFDSIARSLPSGRTDLCIDNINKSSLNQESTYTTKIMKHELGHQMVFKYIHEAKPAWFKMFDGGFDIEPDMIHQFSYIMEGAAEYFAVQNGAQMSQLNYPWEYQFVKPIFDQLGIEKGFKLMLEKPPTLEELLNQNGYYMRLNIKSRSSG